MTDAARFAAMARVITEETRALALDAPAFRSPPSGSARRTVRFRDGANPVVAVRIRDRDDLRVWFDMVAGVVAANRLEGEAAKEVRRVLKRAGLDFLRGSLRPDA